MDYLYYCSWSSCQLECCSIGSRAETLRDVNTIAVTSTTKGDSAITSARIYPTKEQLDVYKFFSVGDVITINGVEGVWEVTEITDYGEVSLELIIDQSDC